jgi:hypothetical protein
MSNNSSKGSHRLAVILQKRMKQVSGNSVSLVAELGTIVSGNKLKIDSIPEAALDSDDYVVCKTIYGTEPLKNGDRVLVIWTSDDDPVVIDKVSAIDDI